MTVFQMMTNRSRVRSTEHDQTQYNEVVALFKIEDYPVLMMDICGIMKMKTMLHCLNNSKVVHHTNNDFCASLFTIMLNEYVLLHL